MRLWHKDIISVLPRKQLIAQWRECCCIAKNIAEKGTPNHLLVNKVLDYPSKDFIWYTNLILEEMRDRGYKVNEKSYLNFCKNMNEASKFFNNKKVTIGLYENWHNTRYLYQCFRNIQEKYDCGMFENEEYSILLKKVVMLSKGNESES